MQAPDTKAPLPAIDFPAMEALRNAQTKAYQAMLVRMRAAMDEVLDEAPGQVVMRTAANAPTANIATPL